MSTSNVVTNRLKLRFKRYIIFLAMILVTFNGMIPASLPVQAVEKTGMEDLEQPNVSKDIDGKESKEIEKGTDYHYNVIVQLPENISGYETMTVSDDLDQRLAVQKTAILINGEVDERFKAVVEGQKVSLALKTEELKELAGKEVKLQITTQVQEDATVGEAIENVAQVGINDNLVIESNPAVVSPIDAGEKQQEERNASKEDTPNEDTSKEDGEKNVKSNDFPPVKKSSKASVNQVQAANGITINDTDQYAITNINGKWHIVQYDGNNPSAGPIAMVELDDQNINNSLALGKNEDVFYATSWKNLYKIYPDGKTEHVTELTGNSIVAGAISPDGTKYVHEYVINNQLYIEIVDLVTLEKTSVPINDQSGFANLRGGDVVFDTDGGLWFSRWSDDPLTSVLAKIDLENGEILSSIPIVSDTGKNFSRAGALSFLPNGKMMVYGSYTPSSGTEFYLFELDPGTGIATEIVQDPGETYDFASRVYPSIKPELTVEKTNDPSGTVAPGDNITYTLKVTNTGNLASTLTKIQDKLPEGTSYVPGTTTLNGEKVADVDGTSPIFKDMSVQSPGESLAGVLYTGEKNAAVVTFQVKVDDKLPSGTEIKNIATVNGDGIEDILSNEVKNNVEDGTPVDPPDACAAPVALINGSFEEPVVLGSEYSIEQDNYVYALIPQDVVPGWKTTASDGLIEIWDESVANHKFKGIKGGVPDGKQVAELNANEASALYQDVKTTPGQTIYWRLKHQGGADIDTMDVRIGSAEISPDDLPVVADLETGPDEWKQYSGTYKVPSGQTTTRFAFKSTDLKDPYAGNILDDIFLGTEPCVTAEKSVNPEGEVYAGDQLTYEMTVKNSGGDVAANTVIEDAIPEGTEYLPGSMKILNGPKKGDVTDDKDDDAGYYVDGKVTFNVGDLPNTNDLPDGITVQFKVKALSSHVGKTIANKAQVKYKNLLTDKDESLETNEVTNNVIERPDVDACAAPVALINGSFEEPPYDPSFPSGPGYMTVDQSLVPGWQTTDSYGVLEIFNKSLMDQIAPGSPQDQQGLKNEVPHGQQMAELNSKEPAQLYQDVETTPGQTIYWRLAHKGRLGPDTMALKIDSANVDPKNLKTVQEMTTDKDEWKYYSGSYVVPAGQTVTRFGFEAVSSTGGNKAAGNFLDDIFLGTEACVTAEKSVSPKGDVFAGDELTYEVTVKNAGGDIAANTIIEDAIPEGTEYVPGSMKILDGPKKGDVTDEKDDDAGHYADGKVTFNVGDLPNTNDLPDGITVQFKVKALSDHAGKDVMNKAQVKYKDLLKDEDKQTETNETKTPIKYKDPLLKSEKSAKLETKAEGNKDADHPEVGDTIRYTITTKNTIEDSLVENLVITDTIPKGLTYVPGSLEVDGKKVSDEKDDDAGHVVEGKVTGTIGNVTDTKEHTVTFLVTVDKGQAGADIKNIAKVGGDNTGEPDEPEEEVKVYPRDPKFESEKTAVNLDQDKKKFEVGDTVVYTIKARNAVSESIIKNFTIKDKLIDGLEYVEGSLKTDPEVDATFENGTFTANFGEVKDTEWRTLTFHAKIQSGQSGKELKNIATVEGEDVPPTHPEVPIKVDPKDPKLESKKSSKLEEKAEGNKDADHPEVGDTIRYTITTKNTIEDSLVENLVITDTIPKGLTYVPGSLEVDGEKVTDAKDDDAGHVVEGKVTGTFGSVTDTKEYTVSFLVTVDKGQAGADIKNIATVGGDNTDEPDEPEEEVKVYPRDPKFESEKTAVNLDQDKKKFEVGDTVVYTIKARNAVSESIIKNFTITDKLMDGLEYVEGSLKADPEVDATFENGTFTANFGEVKDTEWRTLTFHAKIQSGQSGKELKNIATVEGEDVPPTHPEVPIKVDPKDPKLESKKSSKLEEKAEGNKDADHPEVGDTIRYTITTKNTIEDSLVKNLVITDTIPKGLTYVPDSLEVDDQKVTDAKDDDAGHVVDGKVTGTFGHVTDTKEHTVSFLVTVDKGQSGKDIKNIATVGGDNTDEPDEPEEEVKVYPREPKLESKKSSKLEEKAEGNKDADHPEVGDTIRYTITTKNTIEDSLVENLVIADTIPKGLTYVSGSLEVDGEKVTDAKDDDAGHIVEGKVTGTFGNVTDTKEHTVSFLVTVDKGQAGADIKNIATVGGDNTDEPDEPEEEVKVYPRDPKFESEKTAVNLDQDKKKFEVGDTVVYTIKARNAVSESIIKNFTIKDKLIDGLEYVEGSLKADPEVDATFENGTFTANFGEVKDTEWRTLTFHAKIQSGQSGKELKNIATVEGEDVPPTHPEVPIKVDPKDPKLESKKSSKLEEKAEGNKDADHPEVGDTIRYSITTKNTIEDSLVKNLVITDTIPKGLTYVKGSLEVDGKKVTDAKDDDAGHVVEGKVTGTFGNVTDTKEHTVSFLVTVDKGQAGADIKNIATVGGDNTDEPDEPEEEVKVYPRHPKLESKKSAANAEKDKEKFEVGDTIVYTIQARNTVSDSLVKNLTIADKLPEGLAYVADSLKVSHEGKGEFKDGKITATFGDVKDTEWRTVTFEAKIKSGQSGKDIENIATVGGDNVDEPEEPKEKVTVDPKDPVLKSEKSAKLEAKAEGNKDKDHPEVGDTLLYTIKTQNTIEDSLVKNLVISDDIPEGLEYVAGSLKVDGESVTDAKDNDKGYAVDGSIAGQFGDIKDTNWHTVEFLVTVKSGQAGKDIQNIAVVDGDNVGEPDKPEEEVQIYPRHSVFESEKSAENAEKGKEKFEVGDTIVYTIKSRNKVSDSLVENMTISDTLPEGLEYVADSLKVSHEGHEGKGEVKDGKITAAFGDVKDTEWRTVTFEAKIKSGQSGKEIENIATVGGDNVDEPDKPGEKVTVDPKAPKLESKKSAANAEKGKEKYEVGDTIVYTIKARSKESDSLLENLTIADKLPAGLEYVDGSLEVSHKGSGEFKDGKITATFGDVKDTEWRTVTFKAKIQSGQFGETIKNIADISGGNVPDPNHPEAKIEVEPKDTEPKDPTPTPEVPKDPAPTPDQNDDPGVKTPPSDTDKGDGKKLPNTATNLFNYGLIGILAILAGGLLALRRRKSQE